MDPTLRLRDGREPVFVGVRTVLQQREPVAVAQRRVTDPSQDPFQSGTARGNVVRDGEVIAPDFLLFCQGRFSLRSFGLDEALIPSALDLSRGSERHLLAWPPAKSCSPNRLMRARIPWRCGWSMIFPVRTVSPSFVSISITPRRLQRNCCSAHSAPLCDRPFRYPCPSSVYRSNSIMFLCQRRCSPCLSERRARQDGSSSPSAHFP